MNKKWRMECCTTDIHYINGCYCIQCRQYIVVSTEVSWRDPITKFETFQHSAIIISVIFIALNILLGAYVFIIE